MKGKRLGELQDISHENSISLTNRTGKERFKVWMGKIKLIPQLLWERYFMYTHKDVCTFYTLCGQEDNFGSKIIEPSLR